MALLSSVRTNVRSKVPFLTFQPVGHVIKAHDKLISPLIKNTSYA